MDSSPLTLDTFFEHIYGTADGYTLENTLYSSKKDNYLFIHVWVNGTTIDTFNDKVIQCGDNFYHIIMERFNIFDKGNLFSSRYKIKFYPI